MKIFFLVIISFFIFKSTAQSYLLPHIYTADPSAHVWPDDPETLWLYTSHDVPNTNSHKTMFDYHVFSTKDLINWTDYGRVLSVDDVDWAISMAWAVDAVYWKSNYYLVYCMKERATGTTRTGLAISDQPQGPFRDTGYIKGVDFGQDPSLFVDDDGKPYLFWGAGGKCQGAQLTEDLRAIVPETLVDLKKQLFEVFEGPWVHKYLDKYYLSYPGLPNGNWPEQMYYATADKPLGPYTYQKKYIPFFDGQSSTNHGSIIKFKNKWMAFHHSSWLSKGNSTVRNTMADWLEYDKNGTIKNIIPDSTCLGLKEKSKITIFLEAENAPMQGGKLDGTYANNALVGYSGNGYVTGFDVYHKYVDVLVQVAYDMSANLTMRINAKENYAADITVGVNVLNKEWTGLPLKKTNGWEELNLGVVKLVAGDNHIRFTVFKDAGVCVDWFKVKPVL